METTVTKSDNANYNKEYTVLREWLKANNISQKDVAIEVLKISPRTFYEQIGGRQAMPISHLKTIADYYGVDIRIFILPTKENSILIDVEGKTGTGEDGSKWSKKK